MAFRPAVVMVFNFLDLRNRGRMKFWRRSVVMKSGDWSWGLWFARREVLRVRI